MQTPNVAENQSFIASSLSVNGIFVVALTHNNVKTLTT